MRSDWWACDEDSEPGGREVQTQVWRAAGHDASLIVGERFLFTRRAASDVHEQGLSSTDLAAVAPLIGIYAFNQSSVMDPGWLWGKGPSLI